MDHFSKWMKVINKSLSQQEQINETHNACQQYDCHTCFPPIVEQAIENKPKAVVVLGGQEAHCPHCGGDIAMGDISELEEIAPAIAAAAGVAGRAALGALASKASDVMFGGDQDIGEAEEVEIDDEEYTEDDWETDWDDDEPSGVDLSDGNQIKQDVDQEFEPISMGKPAISTGSEDVSELIGKIVYMQDMGLSNAPVNYSEETLMKLDSVRLRKIYDRVMGDSMHEDYELPFPDVEELEPEEIELTDVGLPLVDVEEVEPEEIEMLGIESMEEQYDSDLGGKREITLPKAGELESVSSDEHFDTYLARLFKRFDDNVDIVHKTNKFGNKVSEYYSPDGKLIAKKEENSTGGWISSYAFMKENDNDWLDQELEYINKKQNPGKLKQDIEDIKKEIKNAITNGEGQAVIDAFVEQLARAEARLDQLENPQYYEYMDDDADQEVLEWMKRLSK